MVLVVTELLKGVDIEEQQSLKDWRAGERDTVDESGMVLTEGGNDNVSVEYKML